MNFRTVEFSKMPAKPCKLWSSLLTTRKIKHIKENLGIEIWLLPNCHLQTKCIFFPGLVVPARYQNDRAGSVEFSYPCFLLTGKVCQHHQPLASKLQNRLLELPLRCMQPCYQHKEHSVHASPCILNEEFLLVPLLQYDYWYFKLHRVKIIQKKTPV